MFFEYKILKEIEILEFYEKNKLLHNFKFYHNKNMKFF